MMFCTRFKAAEPRLKSRPVIARTLTLAIALIAGLGLLGAGPAEAGNQRLEPLSAAVRTALAAAVLDRSPPKPRYTSAFEESDWIAEMSSRLPARHKPTAFERTEFLQMVRYEAQRAGLDPHLVLGLIQVESGFRRHAISSAGARGYMQVMPFWTEVIGDSNPSRLFDARTNLRYGCVILRHYIDRENGDLFRALGRYNGSLGRPEYPRAVLAAWNRWTYVSTTPPGQPGTQAASVPAAASQSVPPLLANPIQVAARP
jgi:soluble lytic murein transglycosylase-like protein